MNEEWEVKVDPFRIPHNVILHLTCSAVPGYHTSAASTVCLGCGCLFWH